MTPKEITKSLLKNETCNTCIYKFQGRVRGKICFCPEKVCESYFKTLEYSWQQLNGVNHRGMIIDLEDDTIYIYCEIHNKECCCSR